VWENKNLENLNKIGFYAAHKKYKDIEMFNELCKYQDNNQTPEEQKDMIESYDELYSMAQYKRFEEDNVKCNIENLKDEKEILDKALTIAIKLITFSIQCKDCPLYENKCTEYCKNGKDCSTGMKKYFMK